MSRTERAVIVWKPQPRQLEFMRRPEPEALYGGAAGGGTSDDQITMTFEGASNEQDVEKQINTLDAVIAENPTVLCLSAGDEDSCQAQIEAAKENGISVVAFDSNVTDSDMIAAFRGTDNTSVGKLAGEKLADAIG